jgi:alpha-galactosidase
MTDCRRPLLETRLFLLSALLLVGCGNDAARGGPDQGGTKAGPGGSGNGGSLASGGRAASGGNASGGATASGGAGNGAMASGGAASAGMATGGTASGTGGAAAGAGTQGGAPPATGGSYPGGASGGNVDGGRSSTGGSAGATGGTTPNAGRGGMQSGGQGGAMGGQAGSAGQGGTAVLAATPPMGWNSWNTFACNNLNETLIKGVADTFVSSGMKDAGYQYVNLDDCWMDGRDSSGKIRVNSSKFPSGMAALATYIHGKGLKIGLYSTPGTQTCANIYSGYTGGVGSLGHETSDAQSYASWSIDYLKYDKCTAALSGFAVMRDALRASGRDIFYSINPGDGTGCVPGKCSIDLPKIANMWRIGYDINASWSSVVSLIDQNAPLSQYAGPGHWNDPDMLEVGKLANETEDRAHFSMWAIMAAPLLAGNDIRSMSAATKAILTNTDVIAVDQDALGVQGKVVATPGTNLQVWAKKLSGTNTVAVALLNRGTSAASITAQWSAIGLPAGAANVRDLWSHTELGVSMNSYAAASVPGHGVVMLKITSAP